MKGLPRRAGYVLVAGAVAVVGCGGSSSGAPRTVTTTGAAPARPTTSQSTTTARPRTTPAPTTSARPSTTAPPAGYPTARAAADHLLAAWRAGDRVGARRGTVAAALRAMFAIPVGPVVDRGCDTGEFDTSGCQYRAGGGGLQLNMERRPNGWVVREALFSP